MQKNPFNPKLVAFCCHNSAYSKEKESILKNLSHFKEFRIVELPCSGKIEIIYLLKLFEEGVDGVFLVGCPLSECHYLEGNLRAKRRIEQTRKLLKEIGIGSERVEIFLLDPGTPKAFENATLKMKELITSLGPSPLNKSVT